MSLSLPEGWKIIDYKKSFTQLSTTHKKVKTKECKDSGKFPVVDQGQEPICGYLDDETKLIELDKPIVIFGDHTRVIKWVDYNFIPGADGTKILRPKDIFFPRFFYYQMRNIKLPDKGYSRHFKFLKEADFLLPPLTEQKQIAKKLDKLLTRVERIKTVLDNAPAKIKRFRQSVLASAVGGEFSKNKNITKLPLNKLGSISGGKTPSKSNLEYWTDGSVFWVSAKDMKRFEIDSSIDKITEKAVSEAKMKLIPINSILMVTRSGILAHTFPVAINTTEITINQDLKAFNVNSEIVNYKFLAYILKGKSQNILKECSKDGTTVPSVSTEKLMNYMLNIPNLEEQKAIVKKVETLFAIADKMEANIAEAQKRVDKLTQSILAKAFRGVL